MKRIGLVTLALALVAAAAGAQMMGGGGMHRPGGTAPGTTPGSGYGPMIPGSGFGDMMTGLMSGRSDMGLVVTPSGNVIVTRALDANSDGIFEPEIVALTPAGTEAWTKSLKGIGLLPGTSGDLVLLVEPPATIDPTKPYAVTVVALNVASGAEVWRLALDGIPMEVQPFPGGTYLAVVSRPALTLMPSPGTRLPLTAVTLWAVGPGGNVLWKYDLRR